MLEKQTVIDKIEVLEMGQIQVREAVRIIEDGQIISQNFNRYVVSPGEDVSSKGPKVQAVAAAVWTDEILQSWPEQNTET